MENLQRENRTERKQLEYCVRIRSVDVCNYTVFESLKKKNFRCLISVKIRKPKKFIILSSLNSNINRKPHCSKLNSWLRGWFFDTFVRQITFTSLPEIGIRAKLFPCLIFLHGSRIISKFSDRNSCTILWSFT